MKIIHRYIWGELLKNVCLSSIGFCFMFLIFDFFDRVDNVMTGKGSVWIVIEYFLLKIPNIFGTTLPIAMLVGALFTLGMLSKHSEITAMRAAGMRIFWIVRPVLLLGFALSIFSFVINETLIPYATRRVREIYNIDIREKHKTGTYSREDFWWRQENDFYSVNMFDSRDNTLLQLSRFTVNNDFECTHRLDAQKAQWLSERFGWSMSQAHELRFRGTELEDSSSYKNLPLVINKNPVDFYSAKTDPNTMSYRQLRKFIKQQAADGLDIRGYLSDLYAKISYPLVVFFATFVALPFALRPARSGSMAVSALAGIVIAFTYFAVHSFSLALGRAELWPPLLAAWVANLLMGLVGVILNIGGESPG